MKSVKFVAALLGAALCGCLPARASVIQVVFSGTLDSAVFYGTTLCQAGQSCGLFNSIHQGSPYTITLWFDPTLGTHYGPPNEEFVGGDPNSPSLGAVVNIAGQTFHIDGTNFGDLAVGVDSDGHRGFAVYAKDVYPGGYGFAQISQSITDKTDTLLPNLLSAPFTYTLKPDDYGFGYLNIQDFHIQNFSGDLNDIAFIIDSVTYSVVPNETPLPGAAALFAGGLAMLGLVGARGRRAA